MTQVKEMTNQQLNWALTELLGYSVKPANANSKWYRMVNPQGQEFGVALPTKGLVWNEYAFPYCTDVAASLEVQTAAIVKDPEKYMRNLVALRWARQDAAVMTELSLIGAADLHLATPRERAEAAYLTLSSKQ